jgi:hypothetical protein
MKPFVQTSVPSEKEKNQNMVGVVVHTCDPSYSGSGDLEDQCSRPAQAKS